SPDCPSAPGQRRALDKARLNPRDGSSPETVRRDLAQVARSQPVSLQSRIGTAVLLPSNWSRTLSLSAVARHPVRARKSVPSTGRSKAANLGTGKVPGLLRGIPNGER